MRSHSPHHQVLSPTTFAQTNLISDGYSSRIGTADRSEPDQPMGRCLLPDRTVLDFREQLRCLEHRQRHCQRVTLNVIPPVTIAPPTPDSGPAAPTGQVFNSFASTGAFTLQDGSPACFLFATEDGTISGWNSAAAPSPSSLSMNQPIRPMATRRRVWGRSIRVWRLLTPTTARCCMRPTFATALSTSSTRTSTL